MLPIVATAYTIVLRSGRLITVSDKFKVSPTAITYEASPGYWVTVWLSNVDVAATEKANNEPSGSFTRRMKREQEGTPAAAPSRATEALQAERTAGRKVVTNKELEPTRLTRQAQEAEYERTRHERGMPSRQEMRQRIEEQDRWLSAWAQRMQEERMQAELEALRSELVNVRMELSELSHSLSQQESAYGPVYASPNYYPYFYAPPAHIVTVFPFGHRGLHGRARLGGHPHGRPWLHRSRMRHHFPRISRPSRGIGALPRVMPLGRIAPRHSR
jgi:hypothetical protein